ncbi:hypothetical protein LJR255_004299 [Pararhizobium sp. LjRoot255]|uniref:hypothetical protein n=1 Tax=Pararhizobium sp. LjRoot255 TaxID=3342298 RepID=UPI003ECD9858
MFGETHRFDEKRSYVSFANRPRFAQSCPRSHMLSALATMRRHKYLAGSLFDAGGFSALPA